MAKRAQMPKSAGTARTTAKKQVGSPVVLWGIIGAVALVLVVVIVLQVQAVNRPITTSGVVSEGTSWGPANAPVKIVEYSDFGCTYCRQFALDQGRKMRQEYEKTGKVRFEYRSFIIEGPSTRDAANAAYCAADQGRFWDYSDVLFNKSGIGQPQNVFAKSALKDYGAQIGLDAAQFARCVDSGQFIPDVQNQNAEGSRLGVQATPTFFINNKKIEGAAPYADFKAAVDAALQAAGS